MDVIERECIECGATIQITVYDDGSYDGGHYFTEVTVPDETKPDDQDPTDEWWECEDCYDADGA